MDIRPELYNHFGFFAFRAGAGGGKSFIFQLAASQFDDIDLVILPLITLMKDQAAASAAALSLPIFHYNPVSRLYSNAHLP